MYVCNECNEEFDYPITVKTSLEGYYGVSSLFSNHHRMLLEVCPYCESEDFEEINEDFDDEDDYFEYEYEGDEL